MSVLRQGGNGSGGPGWDGVDPQLDLAIGIALRTIVIRIVSHNAEAVGKPVLEATTA
jgi:hypothetical protein